MESGIYLIKTKREDLYIGQSINIKRRWRFHRWQLKKGIHPNSYLQRKYLKEELIYETIEIVNDRAKLTNREIFYINKIKPLCNFVIPSETDSWFFSKERNNKISASNLGKPKSAEHRKNISLAKMGNKNPMFGKSSWNKGISQYGEDNYFFGKSHSDKSKKLISLAKKIKIDPVLVAQKRELGQSIKLIASEIGVSEKTIQRRVKEWHLK